jgi:hypothetical protein
LYCGSQTFVKASFEAVDAKVVRCRSWSCEHCQDWRRARLRAEAMGGNPNTFLTLTIRADGNTDRLAAAQALVAAWRLIRRRAIAEAARNMAKRHAPSGTEPPEGWKRNAIGVVPRKVTLDGSTLPFIAVFEATKRGTPHLHILCRSKWIDQQWLSVQMQDIANSPIVSVERITTKSQMAGYCAKYTGKAAHQFGTLKRYWKSKDFDQRPEEKKEPTGVVFTFHDQTKQPIERVEASYRKLGYSIEWTGHDTFHGDCDDPWNHGQRAPPDRAIKELAAIAAEALRKQSLRSLPPSQGQGA